MDATTFAADGPETTDAPGPTILRRVLPIKGRDTLEGGPWDAMMLVTPLANWDATNGPGSVPKPAEFYVQMENGTRIIMFPGLMVRGLGGAKRIVLVDNRTAFFIALDVQMLLLTAGDDFVWSQTRTGQW